jgi:hypothetical protein
VELPHVFVAWCLIKLRDNFTYRSECFEYREPRKRTLLLLVSLGEGGETESTWYAGH